MATTPNMGLVIPDDHTDADTWGLALNTAFGVSGGGIDAHDHTTGKGVQVPSAGININADLSFAGFALVSSKGLGFTEVATSTVTSYSDLLFVNSADHNLYFRNSTGTNVQVTAGAQLNVSIVGGIGGDYASVSALLSYVDATKDYLLQQEGAPRPWAGLETGDIQLYQKAANITQAVTLKSPNALAGSYAVTFPTALPSAYGGLSLTSAGQLATQGGSLYLGTKKYTAPGAFTYTPTTGCTRVIVEAVGGGGGGGGVSTSAVVGGGGGASGVYARWEIGNGTAQITSTGSGSVGAAGTGGANTGTAGGQGGDTFVTINGTTYTAGGGAGGLGVSAATAYGTGGAVGSVTGTNLVFADSQNGGDGAGFFNSGTVDWAVGGVGGSSVIGRGASPKFAFGSASPHSFAGTTAGGPGGGGSGAALASGAGGAAQAGGSGAAGAVFIHEFM